MQHHNDSATMMEHFYEDRQRIALSRRLAITEHKTATGDSASVAEQLQNQQALVERCTQLTNALANTLRESVNGPPDLTNVHKLLDQHKSDTQAGQLDDFYSNMQTVLTYLGECAKGKTTDTIRGGLNGNDRSRPQLTLSTEASRQANIFRIPSMIHGMVYKFHQRTRAMSVGNGTIADALVPTQMSAGEARVRPVAACRPKPKRRGILYKKWHPPGQNATVRGITKSCTGRFNQQESRLNSYDLLPEVPCQAVPTKPRHYNRLGPKRTQYTGLPDDMQHAASPAWMHRKLQK